MSEIYKLQFTVSIDTASDICGIVRKRSSAALQYLVSAILQTQASCNRMRRKPCLQMKDLK